MIATIPASFRDLTPRFKSTVLPQAMPATRGRDTVRADGAAPGFVPNAYPTPRPAVSNAGAGNYYEGLRESNDRTGIPLAMVHMHPQFFRFMNGFNRKMLASVGRYLIDNCGVASYAVNTIANYSVPVVPHSLCPDKDGAKVLEDYFTDWGKRADFTNRFNFEDLQRIVCTAMDSDGDIGATLTAQNGFPQVRLYDTFRIGQMNGLDPLDGVVPDKDGVVMGYNVFANALDKPEGAVEAYIPADQLLLLRDAARYDNYRGYSPIRRGSNDLRDENDIKAFTKVKEKINASLAAVIQQNGLVEEDVWGNDSGTNGSNSITANDSNSTPSDKKLGIAELLGGDIPVIEGELKQLDHKSHSINTVEFLEFLAGQFVSGLDLPPAFFLDSKLTGPNIRAVIGKAQRKFDQRKKIIAKFVEFCWLRVIAWGISRKEIPAFPGWDKISFQFPPLLSIDLGDVMMNERADVMCGQMSEKERFGNRGKNNIAESAQIYSELESKLEAAMTLSAKFKEVPLQLILARMGFAPSVSTAVSMPPDEKQTTTTENK